MTMPIRIRELEERDLDAVAAIEAAVNPHPWSRRMFAEELSLPPASRHWLVAEQQPTANGPLVGFGGMMYAPDAAHLMLIAVEPASARQGIATQLCLGLFDEARTRGVQGVTLEVRVSNQRAVAFYHHLGMVERGTRPRYYSDGEDASIFWIDDLTDPAITDLHRQLTRPVTT